ncbi:phosphotransferase [uncultured Fibrella sp.]|uniref:phosphotransferase n=1 Tax=uncultured Fibrella sp. TaxID=1284596 RepID=UPI0035CB6E49
MHLDEKDPEGLQIYLARNGWIADDEPLISLGKPGEGNMNYTLRVRTPNRSLIVKQARGYVEKYPSIAAPTERAIMEGLFYREIAQNPELHRYMPDLLGIDEGENLLVLEDLGDASDFSTCYQPGQAIAADEIKTLITYLSVLHNQFLTDRANPAFANRAMRALNHEHIFIYPFLVDNGVNLDGVQAGLQALAMSYKNPALAEAARQLGQRYLADQPGVPGTLLHGDYYPGSWLRTDSGVKVIDPEFCFYGPAEFDLGVMLAHLHLAQQPEWVHQQVLAGYVRHGGFDEQLLRRFTGIELLRRLIGLAQLPLSLSLDEKSQLLQLATTLVIG